MNDKALALGTDSFTPWTGTETPVPDDFGWYGEVRLQLAVPELARGTGVSAFSPGLAEWWLDEDLLNLGDYDKGSGKGKNQDGGGEGGGKGRNKAPVANDDFGSGFSVLSDSLLHTRDVLQNDYDPDLDAFAITSFDSSGALGLLSLEGAGVFHYDPNGQFDWLAPGEVAYDEFSYVITDAGGRQSTATVTIEITGAETTGDTGSGDPDDGAPNPPPPSYVEAILVDEDVNRLNLPGTLGSSSFVTFSFATATPDYYEAGSSAYDGFSEFTDAQKEATRNILTSVSDFTGLTFVEGDGNDAQMVFGTADVGGRAFAYFPTKTSANSQAADVWLDSSIKGMSYDPGTQAFKTLIHEIGHALGLSHPDLEFASTTRQHTVMTAYGHPSMDGDVSSYMLYDIAALQYLYGANTAHEAGDTVFDHTMFEGKIRTVWDGGGHDVIDASGATYSVVIDLREGGFSSIDPTGTNNAGLAHGTVIEDAKGSAFDDVLIGNGADNTLTGGDGADVFKFDRSWGGDVVTDFEQGADRIDLTGLGISYADLTIEDNAGGALLTHGSDSILLVGTAMADLGQTDFLFA
ncbi:M10 family metallopeptidase C-terminal domain-containing protein [Sedimentitalea sp. HM32M-2]|uniref:M10 family metallopeptidase C-terminal domain-containing protein n=1 Tax=Sedimentitalea sp. HM32M-2 TaxID=3351566 RepID=UPI003645E856